MENVLIVGGNRFVGKRLAARLREAGSHVTLLNRHGTGEADRIIQADRNDVDALARRFGGRTWDVVFDLAAYRAADAETAFTLFRGRVGRYVVVSSIAVYLLGEDLREDDFLAKDHPVPTTTTTSYAAGKRAVEALFARQAPFPVVTARFPFLFGPDDPTRRLELHVARAKARRETFFANPDASFSVLPADEASAFLHAIGGMSFTGAVNYAAAEPLTYRRLLALIATVTGDASRLAAKQTPGNASPYDLGGSKSLCLARARELGFVPTSAYAWMPSLVRQSARELGMDVLSSVRSACSRADLGSEKVERSS